jgi:hypothetical protein
MDPANPASLGVDMCKVNEGIPRKEHRSLEPFFAQKAGCRDNRKGGLQGKVPFQAAMAGKR